MTQRYQNILKTLETLRESASFYGSWVLAWQVQVYP